MPLPVGLIRARLASTSTSRVHAIGSGSWFPTRCASVIAAAKLREALELLRTPGLGVTGAEEGYRARWLGSGPPGRRAREVVGVAVPKTG